MTKEYMGVVYAESEKEAEELLLAFCDRRSRASTPSTTTRSASSSRSARSTSTAAVST
ncbi:hypothetical protein [Streptomyces venezuelae]|uniref:hypothetical protein n=1 Tax=Streptomyces venezuelae TaxID=54571 RepID=UPI00168149C3|nr:hypothetical protein [Streptomyces venezuelae]